MEGTTVQEVATRQEVDEQALREYAEANLDTFADQEERAYCGSCGEYHDPSDTSPLYECGDCGSEFTRDNSDYGSHRCSCGKFASKAADYGCNDCDAEAELVTAWVCRECDEVEQDEDRMVGHVVSDHEDDVREARREDEADEAEGGAA